VSDHARADAARPVTVGEITDLLAWCRRLTHAGPGHSDPTDRAAYQQAKADLLARLTASEGTSRD
jgi:hypothetical protein